MLKFGSWEIPLKQWLTRSRHDKNTAKTSFPRRRPRARWNIALRSASGREKLANVDDLESMTKFAILNWAFSVESRFVWEIGETKKKIRISRNVISWFSNGASSIYWRWNFLCLCRSQLCINTAIVYMHRFYAFHSFTLFHRNSIAAAAFFLAAKVSHRGDGRWSCAEN